MSRNNLILIFIMSNDLQPLVKNLSSYNDVSSKIGILNKKSSELRSERSNLETKIINQIKDLSLETKKLRIDNKSFYLGESKEKPSLTLELISRIAKSSLDVDQANRFIDTLVNYRNNNKKISTCLKIKKKRVTSKSSKKSLEENKTLSKEKSNHHQSLKKKL